MKEETLINGYAKPMHMIHMKSSDESIEFNAPIGFGDLLTNPRKTDNGQTIGERNRAALHKRLDAWLDGTWKESHDD